jgi:hypothetical protein
MGKSRIESLMEKLKKKPCNETFVVLITGMLSEPYGFYVHLGSREWNSGYSILKKIQNLAKRQ